MSRILAKLSLAGIVTMALATIVSAPFPTWSMVDSDFDPSMIDIETKSTNPPAREAPKSVNDLYPTISERYGQLETVNNEEEASNAVDFDVKFPRIEPDYELQLAAISRVDNGNDYVYLFYSSNPIAEDMTVNQFWEDGGVWVIYHKNVTTFVNEFDGKTYTSYQNITSLYETVANDWGKDAYETVVNGHQAIAIADNHRQFVPEPHSELSFAVHDPAQVDFAARNTYVILQGYEDTEELI